MPGVGLFCHLTFVEAEVGFLTDPIRPRRLSLSLSLPVQVASSRESARHVASRTAPSAARVQMNRSHDPANMLHLFSGRHASYC